MCLTIYNNKNFVVVVKVFHEKTSARMFEQKKEQKKNKDKINVFYEQAKVCRHTYRKTSNIT